MREWIGTLLALGAFLLVCFFAMVVPASECTTRQEVHLLPALACLAGFALAGAHAAWYGSRLARLILVGGITMLMALYLVGLRASLPMVYATEISCARQGQR